MVEWSAVWKAALLAPTRVCSKADYLVAVMAGEMVVKKVALMVV